MKISPAPFRGLLFSRAEQLKPGEDKRIGGGNSCGNGDLFLAEAEQLPLFCPIRRQPWREADQLEPKTQKMLLIIVVNGSMLCCDPERP
jgi:hypothetical protein